MKPIPKSITVNTGEQHLVAETIDNFFIETREFVETNYNVESRYFSIEVGEIAYHHPQISDDRITYLSYKDRVLANVLETRTEGNYVHYDFFRNLEGLEDWIW